MADNKFLTNFNNLQEQIYQRLNPNQLSASALKDAIGRSMRAGTDKQLGMIKKNLASTKAGIDVDASNRGLGGSSYNTDAKLRAEQMAAQNAADVEGEYQANLYNAVLNRLNAQDEMAMSARNNAFGLAQGLYGSVYPNVTGGGGGGWGRGGGSRDPKDPIEPPFDPILDNASNNQRAIDARKAQAQQNAQNASNARAASAARSSLVASSNNLNKKVKNRVSGQPVNRM